MEDMAKLKQEIYANLNFDSRTFYQFRNKRKVVYQSNK